MKVWITRNSAFSLQCGGLQRCFMHFTKPEYHYAYLTEEDRDLPFGDIQITEGLFKRIGWKENDEKMWCKPVSVGSLFGHEGEIPSIVWKALTEHFVGYEFKDWHLSPAKIEDFLLELDLNITINNE